VTQPRCSIVIPVHGRAGLTRRCLEAILSAAPRTPFEIIVVDDASEDATPELLAAQTDPVRSLRRDRSGGFAAACNDGAAAARGDLLVFLNNDTEPHQGWLDALADHADAHLEAAVVGAKLLFPDGTVQHAGVVICQDGRPRHIYAGFPADHPAVEQARAFQAVTAACMLVRREAFDRAGGFDPDFRNSLEDVDLCLRIRNRGHEVHYCPASVVTHLESVSRGRGSRDVQHNFRLFQERWEGRVRRDDLDYYVADGLLRLRYRDSYPIGIEAAPELAATSAVPDEVRDLLDRQQRHLADLLREVVRLTAHVAELELGGDSSREAVTDPPPSGPAPDAEEVLRLARALELQVHDLQARLAGASANGSIEPSEILGYRKLLEGMQALVEERVPEGATVLVISRGDDEALDLGARQGWHFPQEADGTYAGRYPLDSDEAVAQLEQLRERGAGYLLVPGTSAWWLDHYEAFGRHLERYRRIAEQDAGALYMLSETDEEINEEAGEQ
jgi:GT2 family glycosyltransferase